MTEARNRIDLERGLADGIDFLPNETASRPHVFIAVDSLTEIEQWSFALADANGIELRKLLEGVLLVEGRMHSAGNEHLLADVGRLEELPKELTLVGRERHTHKIPVVVLYPLLRDLKMLFLEDVDELDIVGGLGVHGAHQVGQTVVQAGIVPGVDVKIEDQASGHGFLRIFAQRGEPY